MAVPVHSCAGARAHTPVHTLAGARAWLTTCTVFRHRDRLYPHNSINSQWALISLIWTQPTYPSLVWLSVCLSCIPPSVRLPARKDVGALDYLTPHSVFKRDYEQQVVTCRPYWLFLVLRVCCVFIFVPEWIFLQANHHFVCLLTCFCIFFLLKRYKIQ